MKTPTFSKAALLAAAGAVSFALAAPAVAAMLSAAGA